MSLTLNIESYLYHPGDKDNEPAQWIGAVVKVHPPEQDPMPETGAVDVEPNTRTEIMAERVC